MVGQLSLPLYGYAAATSPVRRLRLNAFENKLLVGLTGIQSRGVFGAVTSRFIGLRRSWLLPRQK